MYTFLLPILNTIALVYSGSEVGWVTSERDLQRCQESVHAREERLRSAHAQHGEYASIHE